MQFAQDAAAHRSQQLPLITTDKHANAPDCRQRHRPPSVLVITYTCSISVRKSFIHVVCIYSVFITFVIYFCSSLLFLFFIYPTYPLDLLCSLLLFFFFFLNNTAPPEISPFPLPDALPI